MQYTKGKRVYMLFLVKAGTGKVLLDILGVWGRFLCVTEAQSVLKCVLFLVHV